MTPSKPPHKLVRLDHVPEPSSSSNTQQHPLTPALSSHKSPGRPHFPDEDIVLPQLNPTEANLARAQLNASIQRWYRNNPQAVQNNLKDPAEPHPDDLPTKIDPTQPPTPSTPTNASLGGYSHHNTAVPATSNTLPTPARPALKSILKKHHQDNCCKRQPAAISPTLPPPVPTNPFPPAHRHHTSVYTRATPAQHRRFSLV